MSKKKITVPAIAGLTALALVGGVGAATAMQKNDVALTVDGATTNIAVRERTVAEVLELEGIKLSKHDVVLPGVDTRISDGMEINVLVARPFEVTVDGSTREVWTTAKTVEEALGFLDLDAADSKLSASRSTTIGRDGLSIEIITAKDVTLVSGGEETAVRLAGTVGDVLKEKGITPDADDIVTPAATEMLADGMKIQFVDVKVEETTEDKAIPFKKTTVESKKMAKGTTKVTTEGVEGVQRIHHKNVYHDGVLQSSEVTKEEVVKQPVNQVTTVGTYVKPKPKPQPVSTKSSDSGSSTPPPPSGGSRSGGKYDWMRAAGIPESQWKYVDYIVSKESGWNPNARNRSSGACGLAQALPCSKVGPNWNDPVVSLKWQYNYVKSRYGGYQGAYNFWLRNRWY